MQQTTVKVKVLYQIHTAYMCTWCDSMRIEHPGNEIALHINQLAVLKNNYYSLATAGVAPVSGYSLANG